MSNLPRHHFAPRRAIVWLLAAAVLARGAFAASAAQLSLRNTSLPTGVRSSQLGLDGTVVRFAPGSLALQAGQVAAVSVRVENAVNLHAFYLRLTYDASVLEVLDADPALEGVNVGLGDFVTAGAVPENRVTVNPDEHGLTGTIEVATSQTVQPPRSGSGMLIFFSVRAVGWGTARWAYAEVGLSDNTGVLADAALVVPDYRVVEPTLSPTVTSSPTLAPSATPTPTASPTSTVVTTPTVSATPDATRVATPTATPPNGPRVYAPLLARGWGAGG